MRVSLMEACSFLFSPCRAQPLHKHGAAGKKRPLPHTHPSAPRARAYRTASRVEPAGRVEAEETQRGELVWEALRQLRVDEEVGLADRSGLRESRAGAGEAGAKGVEEEEGVARHHARHIRHLHVRVVCAAG